MNKVAASSSEERADLFRETAIRTGLPATVVEKDFWVCWILKRLFAIPSLRNNLIFKGGTSLSKCFGLIRRFSEDIDLAVNYAPLGFTNDRDPAGEMTRSRREKLLKKMMAACHDFIAGAFLRTLREDCTTILTDAWKIDLSETDPNTVVFRYPPAVSESLDYIRPVVLLELGTHSELIPSDRYPIKSYAAEAFPNVFAEPAVEVMSIKAERTFWEKATILHVEFHRPPETAMPVRYSRHYYDMAMLAEAPIKSRALADLALLERVVNHKRRFYASGWANYDLAVPGTLRLIPPASRLKALERDYVAMKVMIFGEAPEFEWMISKITRLEAEISDR